MNTQEAARAAAIESALHEYKDAMVGSGAPHRVAFEIAITAYESAMAETNRALVEELIEVTRTVEKRDQSGEGGGFYSFEERYEAEVAQRSTITALLISIGAAPDGDTK